MNDDLGPAYIGNLIRDRRKALSMSQNELARRLGLNYAVIISQIELGQVACPSERWTAIAEALGLDVPKFVCLCLKHIRPEIYRALFGDLCVDTATALLRTAHVVQTDGNRDLRNTCN